MDFPHFLPFKIFCRALEWHPQKKKGWKRYLTKFLITSQSTHLRKAVRSLNLAFPPKNSSFLDHLLMIRIKGMGNYVKLFWKYGIPPCPFLHMAHFSFLQQEPQANLTSIPLGNSPAKRETSIFKLNSVWNNMVLENEDNKLLFVHPTNWIPLWWSM